MNHEIGIPVIDLREFYAGYPNRRMALAKQVGKACREYGFFTVVGHGVEASLIDATFRANRDFHGLPLEDKEKILISESTNHRGFHPFAAEATNPDSTPDLKEAFDMGPELSLDDPDVRSGKPFHGPNVWPENIPGFRSTLTKYYNALIQLSETLCECFAIDLGMPDHAFVEPHSKPMAQLRLLHYPSLDPESYPNQMGAGEHTDYGSVAILAQDHTGGLEIRSRSGEWIPVEPMAGAFVCNLGDMMEIWTNGLYSATPHRVVHGGHERYSQVFFYDPNFDCQIEPLEICCSPENPPLYEPVIMGNHLEKLFDSTFTYRHHPKERKSPTGNNKKSS